MDDLDRHYQEVGESTGIGLNAAHQLVPEEMYVLGYLAENRQRIVAEPELAQHVFGDGSREACDRVGRMLVPMLVALRGKATLKPTLTHYRGKLAVGLRWQADEKREDPQSTNEGERQVRLSVQTDQASHPVSEAWSPSPSMSNT